MYMNLTSKYPGRLKSVLVRCQSAAGSVRYLYSISQIILLYEGGIIFGRGIGRAGTYVYV